MSTAAGSKLFRRNRALGYVTNHVPAAVRFIRRRKENVIVTCIGRLFHTYSCNHFRLICVSGLHPADITCLASDNYCVYAASDRRIFAWRSGTVIRHTYTGHTANVHLLLPFAEHLIAVDEANVLKVWHIRTGAEYLDLPFGADHFRVSALMHPPTYVNKVLLGSQQGGLQLWNVKEAKLVHTFADLGAAVAVLQAAPAVDVAACGLLDGAVVLLNLKYAERLMEFKQDWGPVTGIAFRTDGPPIMATASTNGRVVFWDLERRSVAGQLRAHDQSVTSTLCLASEPLLFTTSPDNSMKLWIFDMPDGGARLLRVREGHAAPPLCVRYHGADGQSIVSAGEDASLRVFNTVTETLNRSMGRASYNRKASKKKNRFEEDPFLMPPIVHFAGEPTRDKEWDNIAAIHAGLVQTTSWSFSKQRMGDRRLVPEQFHNKNRTDYQAEATCVCVTQCGNFVVIGYSSGDVERFNMQSGIHRARYGRKHAHGKGVAVRGVACDQLNQFVVSGGSDGLVRFWHFKGATAADRLLPLEQLDLEHGIALFRGHRESAVLAVALENFAVAVLDLDTRCVVRRFAGHRATVTDVCFSPDSRWLVTASMDCTVRVWDVPSAYLVDQFRVEKACVSLTMSPTGDFLATAHANYLGLFLWANKALFGHVALRSIDPASEAPLLELPTSMQSTDAEALAAGVGALALAAPAGDGSDDEEELGELIDVQYASPPQLDSALVTMSAQATSRWQNLLNIELVRKRNRPQQPLAVPKQAPFFLPTVAGLDLKFDVTDVATAAGSKVLVPAHFQNYTAFGKALDDSRQSADKLAECVRQLIALGPSRVDFEIRSLSPEGGGSVALMLQFMRLVEQMLVSNENFELAQSYLAVFLKAHGRAVVEEAQLRAALPAVEAAQQRGWAVLEEQLLYGLGVVAALRNFAA